MENKIPPEYLHRDKIFKAKDIIVNLPIFGASFDKLKVNTPTRSKAIVLGYKAWKLGINEEQLRLVGERKIDDKEIVHLLEYKEKKLFQVGVFLLKLKKKIIK